MGLGAKDFTGDEAHLKVGQRRERPVVGSELN